MQKYTYDKFVPFGGNNDGMCFSCSFIRVSADGNQFFHYTIHSINCNVGNKMYGIVQMQMFTNNIHSILLLLLVLPVFV